MCTGNEAAFSEGCLREGRVGCGGEGGDYTPKEDKTQRRQQSVMLES